MPKYLPDGVHPADDSDQCTHPEGTVKNRCFKRINIILISELNCLLVPEHGNCGANTESSQSESEETEVWHRRRLRPRARRC